MSEEPRDHRPPLLVAAAVLLEEGRLLLTRRPRGTHLAGLWELPGGKVEPGEDPREALRREMREEVGLEVIVGEPLEVTFHRYPERDVLLLFFRCRREGEARRAPVRHLQVEAHAWASAEELHRYPLPPADEPVIERVRELLAAERAARTPARAGGAP